MYVFLYNTFINVITSVITPDIRTFSSTPDDVLITGLPSYLTDLFELQSTLLCHIL